MPLVEAHRRTKNYTHVFADLTLKFQPNDLGHVVCDVASQDAIDRLLATPTGFRLYGVQPEPEQALSPVLALIPATVAPVLATLPVVPVAEPSGNVSTPPPVIEPVAPVAPLVAEASPYVLVNGDLIFDLRTLSDAELFEFVKLNAIPDVHPNCKGDTIRDKIVAFLKAVE